MPIRTVTYVASVASVACGGFVAPVVFVASVTSVALLAFVASVALVRAVTAPQFGLLLFAPIGTSCYG